jgi:thiol:disulfide interchange protein DsbC
MRYAVTIAAAALMLSLLTPAGASAYSEIVGVCETDCKKCHQITIEDATDIVKQVNPEIEVLDIKLSQISGLWELVVKARGKRGIAYIDFSKQHIVTGSIIQVKSSLNLTNSKLYELNKVDVSQVPLDDALVMGDPKARYRAIVFDDPDCPLCRKLHQEMQKILEERKDIVFFIKLLPLKTHPSAYRKAKAIVCERSLRMLERALAGRSVPEPRCETTEVDDTIDLAERMGITGTPTVILPDGGVEAGIMNAEQLADLIVAAGELVDSAPER